MKEATITETIKKIQVELRERITVDILGIPKENNLYEVVPETSSLSGKDYQWNIKTVASILL